MSDLFTKEKPIKITASTIVSLLKEKHASDVFVPECKDGPSWGGKHYRMDAWAMNKSWSHPNCTAYEIKVNRSDFLKDDKWHAYLDCCNQLYFVCPTGLIKPEECPANAGLMYVSSTGRMLVTKRKAPYRDVEIPECLWRYILMARSVITASTYSGRTDTKQDRAESWKQWLAERKESKKLGWLVSQHVAQHVDKVERENEQLKKRMEAYDDVRETLKKMNFNPDYDYLSAESVARRIREFDEVVPPHFTRLLESLENAARNVRLEIQQRREPAERTAA